MKRYNREKILLKTPELKDVFYVKSTGSTNDDLKSLFASNGASNGTVLIAKKQTHGRGRQGHTFYSKHGLFTSVILQTENEKIFSFLTQITAVAVAEAIEKCTGESAKIKWVNDIFVRDKKVCGVLAERLPSDTFTAVVGFGINIGRPIFGFPRDIKNVATYLKNCSKNELASEILHLIYDKISNFDEKKLVADYKNRCFILGKRANIIKGDKIFPAEILSLTDDLHLIVRYEDGTKEELNAGEVSLKIN